MDTTTTPQGVRHELSKSDLTVDSIYIGEYQKPGTKTAQLRQTVTTKSFYPSKKTSNSLQANVFSNTEFGFEEQEFTSTENRVAWIPVPESSTIEEVKAKVAAASKNGACIYRVLSNAPILSEDQMYAIQQGLKTKDDFANSQAVRYPENAETIANGSAGKLTLDKKGNVQYRRTFFWLTALLDQDGREKEIYLSPELKAELAGASVMAGQTV